MRSLKFRQVPKCDSIGCRKALQNVLRAEIGRQIIGADRIAVLARPHHDCIVQPPCARHQSGARRLNAFDKSPVAIVEIDHDPFQYPAAVAHLGGTNGGFAVNAALAQPDAGFLIVAGLAENLDFHLIGALFHMRGDRIVNHG